MAAAVKRLWHGLEWFFELIGYGKKHWFAKLVWGLFALCLFIVVVVTAVGMVCCLCEDVYRTFSCEVGVCSKDYCWRVDPVCGNICYHHGDSDDGYIYDVSTREKTLGGVEWIALPDGGADSLVCFSDGERRGYFNKFTGKLAVEPRYTHAWVFSEGLACVEENGLLKFIDPEGQVVIDRGMRYVGGKEGLAFHNGYCIVPAEDGERYGLMDKAGVLVLTMDYESVRHDAGFWVASKGGCSLVLDSCLQPVMQAEGLATVCEDAITVSLPDHTMRRYDRQGRLLNDFLISNVFQLEYETREIIQRYERYDEDGDEYIEPVLREYRPKATARLCAYVADGSYKGLMTADGQVVTPPLYLSIDAIGPDRYLCGYAYDEKVILDGKGNIVK